MSCPTPAFRIPLNNSELKTLGELCAIQGQVEHLLVYTLHYVLDLPLESARTILASNSLHTNAKMWIEIFRAKCADQQLLTTAEAAFALVERTTRGRNDFVHALYAVPKGNMWMLDHVPKGSSHKHSKGSEAIAIRTRDIGKKRSIAELEAVRNDAAKLSGLLADIAAEFLP
jgi:hypothetical protein